MNIRNQLAFGGGGKLYHNFVEEELPRQQNRPYSFTGTVYYVDSTKTDDTGNGLTPSMAKKTITAACTLAPSGSIIQLADGIYNTSAESGGYILLNITNKSLLIRGNSADRTLVTINQQTASSYTLRVRDWNELVVKDLTITSNQVSYNTYIDGFISTKTVVFDNVVFNNLSANAGSQVCYIGGSTFVKYVEFKNCVINKLGIGVTITPDILPAGSKLVITGTTFNVRNCLTLAFTSPASVCVYDSTINDDGNSDLIFQFGTDTSIPVNIVTNVDYRNNTINRTGTTPCHGVLVGRGTNNVYCVNNKTYLPALNSSLDICLGVKTTASALGNAIFKGNYNIGTRPFIIKGGSNLIVEQNTFTSNHVNFEAFGFTNYKLGADEVLSRGSRIKNNNFVGNKYGIYTASFGESENVVETLKTCDINNNKYYLFGKYAVNGATTTEYEWSQKQSFWGASTNDNASTLGVNSKLPILLR